MRLERIEIKGLLDTSHTIAEKLFEGHEYPWEALGDINGFVESLGASLPENEYKKIRKNIWIHKTTQMALATAMGGPMIVRPKVQIRNGAFLKGDVTLGQHVIINNSYEIKNSIVFDETQVPHFNCVGDSTLGYKVHMGVGAVTSNVKTGKGLVKVHVEGGDVETGCKKFDVILDDHAEIGCNSMLNSGTAIGRNSNIHPLSGVHGCVPSDSIYKSQDNIAVKEAKEVETEQEASEAPEKGKDRLKVVK